MKSCGLTCSIGRFTAISTALALALVLSLAVMIMPANPAQAAVFDIADGDVAGLIAAINTANVNGEPDTINLAVNGTYTLNISDNDTDGPNGLPSINSTITINGNGAIIQRDSAGGTPNFRIFHVAATGNVSMFSMTIRNGNVTENDNDGGGLYNYYGDVTLTNCTVSGNKAGYYGGGLYNYEGTVTMTDCTVSGNIADAGEGYGDGGGIYNEDGNMTLTSCTVSGNTANNEGGGIYNYGGILTMTDCTVSGNTADYGGGVYNHDDLTMTNCTVSGNTANDKGGGIYNGNGSLVEQVLTMTNCTVSNNVAGTNGGGIYNDIGDTLTMTCTIAYGNTPDDIDGVYTDAGENIVGSPDPLLGPLQDNGGPTETHALLAGSPAIDGCTGGNCTVSTDQRGVSRPQGDECDIGAYEVGDCCDEVATATATGTVELCVSSGVIENLTAVGEGSLACPEEGKPNLEFTHGFLSFNVTGFIGNQVAINITLPQAVPVGAQYWKCQNNTWVDVTALLGDDDGDNLLTLTITDGGLGDADGIVNGVIEDPGAPGAPGQKVRSPVGGEVYPVDRLSLLAPWLGLAAFMSMALAVVVIMKRRRSA